MNGAGRADRAAQGSPDGCRAAAPVPPGHRDRRPGGLRQGHARPPARRATSASPSSIPACSTARWAPALLAAGPEPRRSPRRPRRPPRRCSPADSTPRRLRAEAVAQAASIVAAIPGVRAALLGLQRQFAADPPAGPAARAGRRARRARHRHRRLPRRDREAVRHRQPRRRAPPAASRSCRRAAARAIYARVLQDMKERDARDAARAVAPLDPGAGCARARHHRIEFGGGLGRRREFHRPALAGRASILAGIAFRRLGVGAGQPWRTGTEQAPSGPRLGAGAACDVFQDRRNQPAGRNRKERTFIELCQDRRQHRTRQGEFRRAARRIARAAAAASKAASSRARVVAIENDIAIIDVGLKSEGRVPLKEFAAGRPAPEVKVGDTVEVYLERIEDKNGEAVLSREKARREEAWTQLEKSFKDNQRVTGAIFGRVKGGFTVDLSRRRGLPAGQPGRHPPGARRRPADGHAAAVPDPQDGPLARQHRGVAPRRARGEPRRAAHRAGRQPEGRPDPGRRGQEHHRLRRLRRSRRRRRPAARHRHRLAAHQPSVRGAAHRPDREGAGDPLQPGDPAHLARHEAARGRSVGGRRGQVSGRRQVHGPRHQHHRLRRLRRAGAGRRGPGPRLRDELDQEERASRQDRLDQPGGRGDGARGRPAEAPHQPRPEAVPGQSVGELRREASGRHRARGRGQATSPSSACSSACPATSTAWCISPTSTGSSPARRRSRTYKQGRHGHGQGARRRRREGAHQPRHQAARGRSVRDRGQPASRRATSSPARSPRCRTTASR